MKLVSPFNVLQLGVGRKEDASLQVLILAASGVRQVLNRKTQVLNGASSSTK
jgi:hypothetical protein